MGEATRDESTAIAQRLAAVGELYARRVQERAECRWWSTDATDQVFALADYSGVAEPDLFMERHGAHPTGEMTLRGMRLAVMSESGRTYHKQGAR
jgi:glutathione S-transferase